MQLHRILVETAMAALDKQKQDGAMPSGHNGPYMDPETPVRNTAHWCMTFNKAYEISGEKELKEAAENARNFLHSETARPMGGTFWCRKNPEKDFTNGVVGQAWAIEALLDFDRVFGDKPSVDLAERVFLLHPFDKATGAWRRVNVDGSYHSFDAVFNHQLWFAAAGAQLQGRTNNHTIKDQLSIFFKRLPHNLNLYGDGLIRQQTAGYLVKSRLRRYSSKLSHWRKSNERKQYMYHKSVGYHSFNLYAFALLKESFPEQPFWNSPQWKKLWNYTLSEKYKRDVKKSKYAYPYNPPGFEVSFALQVFQPDMKDAVASWLKEQMNLCFDFDTNLMTGGSAVDVETAAARIYEATRLLDYKIEVGYE